MEDYKQAALNLYPNEWVEVMPDFTIDNNAPKRAVAEEVFKVAFEKLKTEHVADSVAKAFLRRSAKWGNDNNAVSAANMSTALMAAIIAIRDDE
jgi:hypothetical protein